MVVYVINQDGKPLMPCKPAKAKHLLRDQKAKVVRRTPFTIKLLWECEAKLQEVTAGMDTGSKMIGCAAVANGHVVYQAEVTLRQDISKKMERRKAYRRTRRQRKTRYRKARWQNRASSRREGRLAPSVKSKVASHLREKQFVESILPVSRWVVETASFDIHKISNPEVHGPEYQNGQQKGFYNVKAFVLHRDGHQCQKCKTKKGKLHVHHLVFRSQGGSDEPNNLLTLCVECHEELHRGEFTLKGRKAKTKHATEMGFIKAQIQRQFGEFTETFGYETKFQREQVLHWPKTHYADAVAICCTEGETVIPLDVIYLKRHVAKGDYQQTKGKHSEKKIPTGKLFGLRKFDLVKTPKGIYFVKGKRSTGRFALADIGGNIVHRSVDVKKRCLRIKARSTTLVQPLFLKP